MTHATEQRRLLLRALLEGTQPLDASLDAVAKLPWDSEEELVTLTPVHVINRLEQLLSGDLTSDDLERWANAIEGRDDIVLDPAAADALGDVIFELANPSLQGSTTTVSARAWVTRLTSGSSR